MISYWEEDTETLTGRPFDLEKHDKEISNKWLDKVKKAREEISDEVYRYSGSGEEVIQGYCDGLKASLKIIDKFIDSERYKKTEKALEITCELLNGGMIYGIDADTLWNKIMELEGVVSSGIIEEFILNNVDRFSDDEKERNKAIKRLGW